MPCDSSHYEASEIEAECQNVAKHLVYVHRLLGQECPNWIISTSMDYYGSPSYKTIDFSGYTTPASYHGGKGVYYEQAKLRPRERCDILTSTLCTIMKEHGHKVYDDLRTSREARNLANWWEDHLEADKRAGRASHGAG